MNRFSASPQLEQAWNIRFVEVCPGFAVPGSPERCIERGVLRDADGGLWLLERLATNAWQRHEAVARTLDILAGREVPGILPCRKTSGGEHLVEDRGAAWRLTPYVPPEELPRPGYVLDERRGEELGRFLCALRGAAQQGGLPQLGELFFLSAHGRRLRAAVAAHNPELLPVLAAVLDRLASFFEAEEGLPQAVCHGDVHPLNVIWSNGRLAAVIDWEFAGPKAALYDAANCLGCVGAEGPQAFAAGVCPALAQTLVRHGGLADSDIPWLVPAIAATRLGWLSEWLRRGDREMIRLEFQYMDYLLENGKAISHTLRLPGVSGR